MHHAGFLGLLLAIQRCHLTRLFGFDLMLSQPLANRNKTCHYFESKKCTLDKNHPVVVERAVALAMGQLMRTVEGTSRGKASSYFLEIKGCSEETEDA